MKKFIQKILLFFAVVTIIDIGVGFIGDYLQTHAKGGDTKRTNDLVMKDQYDVLILGSSRAHHHYDAPYMSDFLGLHVYNAGYDGNGIVLAAGLLELILERYQPKLILFDVEPAFDIYVYKSDNNNVRYISNLKPYYRHDAIGRIILDVSLEEWYKVHSGMMRYNSCIFTMFKETIRGGTVEYLGYVPLKGEYCHEPNIEKYEKAELDHLKLKYIEKLISAAKSNNIPIVFVASPKFVIQQTSTLQPVKDICRNHNIDFWDYYSETDFIQHPEWFKEPMHLNQYGAKEFTELLSYRIRGLFDL